jgi:hypothetical protein
MFTMKIYFKKKITKKNFNKNVNKFTIVEYLTENGKYTIKNNKLVHYKLENIGGCDKDLGNGYYASSEIWKINENVFTIPFNHIKVKRNILKYKIDDKLFYIEETINEEYTTSYLLSGYRIGESKLKELLNKL